MISNNQLYTCLQEDQTNHFNQHKPFQAVSVPSILFIHVHVYSYIYKYITHQTSMIQADLKNDS